MVDDKFMRKRLTLLSILSKELLQRITLLCVVSLLVCVQSVGEPIKPHEAWRAG